MRKYNRGKKLTTGNKTRQTNIIFSVQTSKIYIKLRSFIFFANYETNDGYLNLLQLKVYVALKILEKPCQLKNDTLYGWERDQALKTFIELTKSHDEPPQPVVLMGGQVSGLFDNQGPLG